MEGTADWLRPSVMALVVANLVPLLGVLAFGWEVFPVVFRFWSENVIVGGFNALKMLLANPERPAGWVVKVFMIPFFCFHYGLFTFVHGIFVIVLFGGDMKHGANLPSFETFQQAAREYHLVWAILGLAASHGVSFVSNYRYGGEYKRANLPALMRQPYGRMVVLHVAILGGGFLIAGLRSPV